MLVCEGFFGWLCVCTVQVQGNFSIVSGVEYKYWRIFQMMTRGVVTAVIYEQEYITV